MIIVIDYDAGNLHNVARALKYLGRQFQFSRDPDEIREATHLILPGVGSAAAAMESLALEGLVQPIREARCRVLGICLGMQLLFSRSEENSTDCLGVIPGVVSKFDSSSVKVPHSGWNLVGDVQRGGMALFQGLSDSTYFYFVHSYFAHQSNPAAVSTTEYSIPFASAVRHQNYFGVQFHPELSGEPGLKLLSNFLEWNPKEESC
jgi:glutamine amidotransferase